VPRSALFPYFQNVLAVKDSKERYKSKFSFKITRGYWHSPSFQIFGAKYFTKLQNCKRNFLLYRTDFP